MIKIDIFKIFIRNKIGKFGFRLICINIDLFNLKILNMISFFEL